MHKEHGSNEVHALAIACLRIVSRVSLENVEESIISGGVRYHEFLCAWERPCQVLFNLKSYLVILFVDEFLQNPLLVLTL